MRCSEKGVDWAKKERPRIGGLDVRGTREERYGGDVGDDKGG